MHFTCIWVNISRFKMVIKSGYIEDMKIIQEQLKKSAICRSRYLLDRSSICQNSLTLDTCVLIYRAYRTQTIANNVFIPKGYLFIGMYNHYKTRKTQGLWVCIIPIGLEKSKVCVNLFGIGKPIKLLFKGG